ncbi:MAG: hypothetical protein LBH87_02935 [Coriobacteriales bacterium]|jgi:hypothetical protein|nr:hypothetical protein [Coriobacteriales bacterium]
MNEQTATKRRWFQGRRTLAIILAIAVCLTALLAGTFAWSAISQMALNENVENDVTPGGRLHDDFNGQNLDVYAENYGTTSIYAKVKLLEYMEVGDGAGLKGTYDPNGVQRDDTTVMGTFASDAGNMATPMKTDALIGDISTWAVHTPLAGVNNCGSDGGGGHFTCTGNG